MPPPDIHIDSLRLDLRGVSPAVARTALASLGPALEQALAARGSAHAAPGSARIEHVATPAVSLAPGADAATLRHTLAEHLATAITGQLSPTARTPTRQ